MALEYRVSMHFKQVLETMSIWWGRAVKASVAKLKARAREQRVTAGPRLAIFIDTEIAREIAQQVERYLAKISQRMVELRIVWTDEVRQEISYLLYARLLDDRTMLLETRKQCIGDVEGSGLISSAEDIARRQVEEELAFFVLRQERWQLALEDLLQSPRYAMVLQHWRQANVHANDNPPAEKDAVREALLAAETLVKLIVGTPQSSLGQALPRLMARVDEAGHHLLTVVRDIWSFSNKVPEVRHGGVPGDKMTIPEMQCVLRTTEGALRLLLNLDLGVPDPEAPDETARPVTPAE